MKRTHSLFPVAALSTVFSSLVLINGCGVLPARQPNQQQASPTGMARTAAAQVYQVTMSRYVPDTKTVDLRVQAPPQSTLDFKQPSAARENLVDLSSQQGLLNYAASRYPSRQIDEVQVTVDDTPNALPTVRFVVPPDEQYPVSPSQTTTQPSTVMSDSGSAAAGFVGGYGNSLPPGVRLDRGIRPVAALTASRINKASAVLSVARSKLGTPYIWGHNEDRGQYGFDCSNFTAYVYHHALGEVISDSSRIQARSVGWQVPRSQMQPGDLLIFSNGVHVGIYAGGSRMIECGGGLGRVGYLSVGSGSYWGRHLTAVKRLF